MISYHPIIQTLEKSANFQLDVLRLDLIDAEISGNKWFKLNKNIEKAVSENHSTIITFGGAFSNHIVATSAACQRFNLKCIGIIRGEENPVLNETLDLAKKNGMILHYVNREIYANKNQESFKNWLREKFGSHYLIPEGGANNEGVIGCTEILKKEWMYDYVFSACGTGTTYGGLLQSSSPNLVTVGISVLKGENTLPLEIQNLLDGIFPQTSHCIAGNEELDKLFIENDCILNTYSFKGYAKFEEQLVKFKKSFEQKYDFELDHVYTVKLAYAIFDLLEKGKLKFGAKTLMIHSGGLQGNVGFEKRYALKASNYRIQR